MKNISKILLVGIVAYSFIGCSNINKQVIKKEVNISKYINIFDKNVPIKEVGKNTLYINYKGFEITMMVDKFPFTKTYNFYETNEFIKEELLKKRNFILKDSHKKKYITKIVMLSATNVSVDINIPETALMLDNSYVSSYNNDYKMINILLENNEARGTDIFIKYK